MLVKAVGTAVAAATPQDRSHIHLVEKGELDVFVGPRTSSASWWPHESRRGVQRVDTPVSGAGPVHGVSPPGRDAGRVHLPAVFPEGLLFLRRSLC